MGVLRQNSEIGYRINLKRGGFKINGGGVRPPGEGDLWEGISSSETDI